MQDFNAVHVLVYVVINRVAHRRSMAPNRGSSDNWLLVPVPIWHGRPPSVRSTVGVFGVMPASPVYAGDTFVLPVFANTGVHELASWWVFVDLKNVDALAYVSHVQNVLHFGLHFGRSMNSSSNSARSRSAHLPPGAHSCSPTCACQKSAYGRTR